MSEKTTSRNCKCPQKRLIFVFVSLYIDNFDKTGEVIGYKVSDSSVFVLKTPCLDF